MACVNRTAALLLLVPVLLMIPSVHGQTTNVAIQSSSSYAVLRSDDTADFTVIATITFTGFIPLTNVLPGSLSNLIAIALDETESLQSSTASPVNGTATSSPDQCISSVVKPGYLGYASCYIAPSPSSGSETVTFKGVIYNAENQQYSFQVFAGMYSTYSPDAPFTYVEGSGNYASFDVGIVNRLNLTVVAPAQVPVTIDGAPQSTTGSVTAAESPGIHTISVPQTVQIDDDTRLNFQHWSDGATQTSRSLDLEDNTQLTTTYVTQYSLTLTDPSATGGGWYFEGANAQISAPAAESCPGILGTLGCTQMFKGWYENGVLVSSTYEASISMNGPHTLDTQWSTDMLTPLIILVLVFVIGGGLFAIVLRRRRAAPPCTTFETPAPPILSSSTKEMLTSSGPYCINCGKQLPVDAKFCWKCGSKQE